MADPIFEAKARLDESGHRRAELWLENGALTEALAQPDFLERHAVELVSLILEANARVTDALLCSGIERAVRRGLGNPTFFKAFANGVVKQGSQARGKAESVQLLKWAAVVIRRLPLPKNQKPVTKLLQVVGKCLDRLGEAAWHRAAQHWRALVKAAPLREEVWSVGKEMGSPSLIRLVADAVAVHDKEALRVALLTYYSTNILAAKTAPTAPMLAAFRQFLGSLTKTEFGESVMPAWTRGLRRNPEVVLDVTAAMVSALHLDVSHFGMELLTSLLQFVRHPNADMQTKAVENLTAIARLVSDGDVLEKMGAALEGLLSGKSEGKIRNIQERLSLARAVRALAASPAAKAELSRDVTARLAEVCDQEVSDEVRAEILRGVGAWLPPCQRIPDPVLKLMSSALSSKEAIRNAALEALTGSRENSTLFTTGTSLVPSLCKVVDSGLSKPALKAEGIAALLLLSLISAADPKSDDVVEKAGVWDKALKSGSSFFEIGLLGKLPATSTEILASLCQQLLLLHVARVDRTPGCLELLSRVLVVLCLHGTKSVRAASFAAVLRCLGASSALMLHFLDAFQHFQEHLPDAAILSGGDGDGDTHVAQVEIKGRYIEALMHLLPFGIDSSVEVLAKVLFVAHHPIVQTAKRGGATWKALVKQHPDSASLLENAIEHVAAELVGERGLRHPDRRQRTAALGVVSTCAESFPDLIYANLQPFLQSFLAEPNAEELTQTELQIFRTPEGKLSTEMEGVVVILPDARKKQRKKKPKGRYRHEKVAFAEASESSEEEEEKPLPAKAKPADAVKAGGKGKKPGHLDAAERQLAFREKQLEEEAKIRVRVRNVQDRLEVGLQTLSALIKGNATFSVGHLAELSCFIVPHLTSDLVGEGAAFDAARALAMGLPAPLNLIPLDVAVVLRLVALYEKNGSVPYEEIIRHASMLAVMHGVAALQVQSGGAFFLLLPVLRVALSSVQSPYFDEALKVLTDHCKPGEAVPREDTFALLYQVLSRNPATRALIVEALKNLCLELVGREIFSVLDGLLFSSHIVRSAALQALSVVPSLMTGQTVDDDCISALLLVACHDVQPENSAQAEALCNAAGIAVAEGQKETLVPLVGHGTEDIRRAAIGALAQYLQAFPLKKQPILETVITALKGHIPSGLTLVHGILIGGASRAWFLGGALFFEICGKLFAGGQTELALEFLLTHGLTHPDDIIRGKMVQSGLSLVDGYDPRDVSALFDLLEQKLTEARNEDHSTEADDRMREGAIVLLGSVAKHLSPEDAKLRDIIDQLLEVLPTPAEAVQRSASICLSPLITKCQSDPAYVQEIVQRLKSQIAEDGSYGHRRGAAYGIAGIVKGCGISSLKKFEIMDTLIQYVENKSSAAAREGGLCAFDCLSQRLQKLFEPYVIHILPLLLTCYGDAALSVRQATADAAKTIMHNLSAPGVKLVMPPLMKGLEDKAWRTKQGSIQLLGSMAWCAPKQLSTCLPTVVPKLITVLADPHPKVHSAAELALQEVASTIHNPEVQKLVPDILSAIAYPSKNTVSCLEKLLESRFQTTIDAPSLALIVPVVHHGLKDRAGENKKRAARIVQNLCKLVNDPKDMDPYTHVLLPELKKGIVDTLPDVRAQASKALSGLMYDIGKKALDDVMPWLLETLESKSSAVERSGAAQAISEVLAVYGDEYFESLLPKILENCSSESAVLREGGIAVLRFLPYSMPETFQAKLDVALPFILDGLADENEAVRDISLGAGRTLVDIYAQTSLPVILPAVESSLFHANWRIRQSSVELLGNLIFKVAGTTGKIKLDGGSDDEGPATQSYGRNLIRALGLEERNAVLAKLYMARSDVQHPVRTAALHIWKTVVVNTPKTLMETLSALMELIIEMLAFGEEDSRQTSARCLGELVRKMGDRFLPKIIPIMEKCLGSENTDKREGACYGLRELLDSMGSAQLAEYLPVLLPTIQATLCDADAAVREAAAVAFDALFKAGASSVVDSVIPDLLHKLEQERTGAQALEGLRVILSIRPHTFENMIPKLLKEPVTSQRLSAFAALSEVAPGALRAHLPFVAKLLMKQGSQKEATDIVLAARKAVETVVRIFPEEQLPALVAELKKGLEDASMRLCAAQLMPTLAASQSITDHVESLLQSLVSLMSEDDPEILQECWNGMKSVAASVPKELRSTFVQVLTDAVDTAKERERRKDPSRDVILVPGFCLAGGIGPVLPFYIEGVQGASGDLRESSATGLGELIAVMDAASLKPFVGLIMGPLIRIINDRFPWQVKQAILKTMGLLIFKAGDEMRKFVAALQPIFLKCLPDPTEAIRDSAAKNLGHLTRLSPRIDPLINNLGTFAVKMEPPMRNAYLSAMAEALVVSGEKISAAILQKTGTVLLNLLSSIDQNEENVVALAVCLGSFCKHCDLDTLSHLLQRRLTESSAVWTEKLLTAVFMATIAKHAPARLHESQNFEAFTAAMTRFVRQDSIPVKKAACRVAARLLMSSCREDAAATSIPVLTACLSPDQNTEIHDEAVKSVQLISATGVEFMKPYLKEIVPLLCALAREVSGSQKAACETAISLILDLSDGLLTVTGYLQDNPGAAAKSLLVEPYLRRIQRLNKPSEHEVEKY